MGVEVVEGDVDGLAGLEVDDGLVHELNIEGIYKDNNMR